MKMAYRKLESPKQEQGVDVAELVETVEEFYNKIRFIDAGRIIHSKLIDYYINSTLNEDLIDQVIKIGDLKNNTRIVDAFIGFYKFLNEKDSTRFSVRLVKLAHSSNALLIKICNAEKERVEELKTKKIHRQIKWGIAVAVLAVFTIVQINKGQIRSASSSQKSSNIERVRQNQTPKNKTQKIFYGEKPQNN
jgi:hypothetical protein